MTPESALKPCKALTGVHGVHLVSHFPFLFQEMKQHGDFSESTCGASNNGSNQRLISQKVWHQRPACLRPIHCGHNGIVGHGTMYLLPKYPSAVSFITLFALIFVIINQLLLSGDRNLAETIANVLTSLPFIALGLQVPRKNLNCRIYANSLIGVGVASSFYHASRGRLRKYLRWADYTMIATSTVCLSRALRNENPKFLIAASAFFLPIQPLMVSAVHTGMMEVAFAKRAFQDPDLRTSHNVHKMSSLLGGALFIADDLFPETPFLHAGWHLAAAVGVSTCNKLLE